MDNVIKNYEEVLEKPPTTRLYLKFLKHKWDSRRYYKKQKEDLTQESKHEHNDPPAGIDIVSFAIVLDDVVVEVMNVQKEFGDILEKGPMFIPIDKDQHRPHVGWVYKDGEFITLESIAHSAHLTRRG